MMRKTKIVPFAYLLPDAKAMEAELNRRAEAGWALHWLRAGLACFRQTDRRDLRYSVELGAPSGYSRWDDTPNPTADYLRLCDDAGWLRVAQTNVLRVFASKPGSRPAPIQTDPALDFEANWKRALRQAQWSAAAPLAVFLLNIARSPSLRRGPAHLWDLLLSTGALLCAGCVLLLLAACLFYILWLVRCRTKFRRAVESGKALPTPNRLWARLRALASGPGFLLLILLLLLSAPLYLSGRYSASNTAENAARMAKLPVVRAVDLGLAEGTGSVNYLLSEGSPFLRHVEALDLTSRPPVRTERYDCRWSWLAGAVADSLLSDEGDETAFHLHDPIVLEPVELGFGQAWLYVGEDGWQSLLLREGNTVASVEGEADFTDPAVLDLVRARLGWEGYP